MQYVAADADNPLSAQSLWSTSFSRDGVFVIGNCLVLCTVRCCSIETCCMSFVISLGLWLSSRKLALALRLSPCSRPCEYVNFYKLQFYYLCRGGYVIYIFLFHEQVAKRFQAIFVKPCKVMDYCRGKRPVNIVVDSTQNGQLATTISSRCVNLN